MIRYDIIWCDMMRYNEIWYDVSSDKGKRIISTDIKYNGHDEDIFISIDN